MTDCIQSAGKLSVCVAFLISAVCCLASAAQALPKYAQAEKKPCTYCHVSPKGGGERNYRGLYYALHNHTFAEFDDAAEAKKAGVPTPAASPDPAPGPDLLKPTTQEDAWDLWQFEVAKAERRLDGDTIAVQVTKATGTNWHLQLRQFVPTLVNGTSYTLTFRARADKLRELPITSLINGGDFHNIGLNATVTVSNRWRLYTCTFTAANVSTDPKMTNIVPTFLLGTDTGTVWFRDIQLHSGKPVSVAESDPATVRDFGEAQFAGMPFVRIPPGVFVRGTTKEQKEALIQAKVWTPLNGVEQPARSIHITRPFFLGQVPVTQAVYKAVMGKNPSAFPGDDLPVDSVTWNDAQAFCKALTAKSGGKARYRLPTEAEWEYACRAGSWEMYGNGEENKPILPEILNEYAWFSVNSGNRTHPVGTRRANAWGLYDMTGNVWQWCADTFSSKFYTTGPDTDPLAKYPDATERVLRGGCWFLDARAQRPAVRGGNVPEFKSPYVGLRVVREF